MVTVKFCLVACCICFVLGVCMALFFLGITSLAEESFREYESLEGETDCKEGTDN